MKTNMQNAHVSSITDDSGYMLDVRTDNFFVSVMGVEGDITQRILIGVDQLDDTIRVLQAIQFCNRRGWGVRPLHSITRGDFTGCLCMELVRASDDGVHRDVHIVHSDDKDFVGLTVTLKREDYVPFAPSAWENPDAPVHNKGEVTRAKEPILPHYVREAK